MSNTRRTTYKLVLGKNKYEEVIILEDIFEYEDGFTGATGAILGAVSDDMIQEALQAEEKEMYYEELWRQDAGSTNGTTQSLTDWIEDIVDDEEYLESKFETYLDIDPEEIAMAVGEDIPERYSGIGFGRIFPQALEDVELIDSEEVRAAVAEIQKVEN